MIKRVAIAFGAGLVFFAFAIFSVLYTRFEGGPAFLWGATGVSVAILTISPVNTWAERLGACAIASFIVTAFFSLGVVPGIALAAINISEILIATLLLRYFRPDFDALSSPGEVLALTGLAGIAAPAISAVAGAAVIAAYTGTAFWPGYFTWLSGHALGTLVTFPLMLLFIRGDYADWWRTTSGANKVEAAAFLVALAGLSMFVFSRNSYPILVLPFPLIMALVFRHGRIGATLALSILAVISVSWTVAGYGPIGGLTESAATRGLLIQLYIAAAVLTVLPAIGDLGRMAGEITNLQKQSALYKLILDSSGDIILTFDNKGIIRFASPSTRDVLGIAPEHLVGTLPQAIIHRDDIDRVVGVHMEVYADPSRTRTVDYRICIDGQLIGWFETHARATLNARGQPTGTVCVVRNISERKHTERALSDDARTDPLTKIANRRAFDEAMAKHLSQDKRGELVIALFDLDHFKSINDTYGHALGDEALKMFASVLQSQVRSRDLAARIGGEEFAVIIDGDTEIARRVCERIRQATQRTRIDAENGEMITVTVSSGLCPVAPSSSLSEIMQTADAALYEAKRSGRNRIEVAYPSGKAPGHQKAVRHLRAV